ncbi:hypothetical protein PVAP13_8KG387600 [Panicum virgatum]|uniref:AAA+ ATPase domain-containing protein n=1 Tax=Panicum virgatum TaxID=38727 RepID=A0A8T0PUI3_PANVG|nr:hypothetical protein PVAP13_8KG387600 [Panicum virgatum]
MASPLQIAAGGWGFVVMGWMLSPILSFLVNKFFTNLSLDISRKLRKLEIDTIPSLKETLTKVEEQRMVEAVKGKGSESNLVALQKIENDLKSVLYEAEDILDLVDYHRIEKKVKGDGPSWISRAVGACITRCKGTWLFRRCIEGIRPALCQCAKGFSWLAATLCRSGEQIPISQEPSNSNPVVQRLRAWSQSLDIKALCQSMQNWLAETYVAACHYRDWSYEVVGINKTNKEDDIAVDLFFLTIDGKSLWKRIEDIENILNDLKKSHLLNQDSSSSSKIVAEDTNKEETDDMHRRIERKVFGRDEELERICSMLRKGSDADGSTSSSSKPYSVFGIHGITGFGKTTLAQYVCDHEKKAQDKHFDTVMFIHVSKTFRLDKIFRDMLSEIKKGQQSDSNGVTALHNELKKNLEGKRFLLVLDDLWVNNENRKGRDILLDALDAGQSGSIILVTAQRADAAAALGAQKPISIRNLEENDYLELFMHHARPGTIEDDGEYKRIGTKIANKLHRSPIAAVTVGGQLLNRSISFWETTANDVVLNETMGALWWSYQQLGADIRRCFAYCSTFPRGYELKRDELVRIWIAQGFVSTGGNATEEMEDVGNRYFDELLEFSFLQVQGRTLNGTEVITIHDLLHELAETVAGSDFLRIDLNGSPKDIPAGVRHVFIETNNGAKVLAEKNQDLGKLRTLIIKEHWKEGTDRKQPMDELEEVFDCLFMRMRELRVLIVELLQKTEVMSVPASVDRMKHLRCLGFRFFGFTRLTSLQTLPSFTVKKEQGYELKQLKHLNKLRGALRICGLGIVGSKEEALEAQLARKERVTQLDLDFGYVSCNPDVAAEVLEGLRPPKDLVELDIWSYYGSRYPSWMLSRQQPDAPKRLQKLVLRFNCSRLASIPEDSELFTHLRELHIMYCDWDRLPENMERLVLLQNLFIDGCKKMELLPTLPQSLRKIRIHSCGLLSTTCEEEGHENWHKIQHIPEKYINP